MKLEATKRLLETKVTAADATDAGKALLLLESIFGKATKRRRQGKSSHQVVTWATKDYEGDFRLDTETGEMSFFLEVAYGFNGNFLSAKGDTFEKFEKALQLEIKKSIKELDDDIKSLEKQIAPMADLRQKLSKV